MSCIRREREHFRSKWNLATQACFLIVILATGGCRDGSRPKSGSESPKSFNIGMVTFAGYAPFYLAKEKGFFNGVAVELHRIEEIATIRAAMANGKLDAYLATPDIALDTNTPPPGVAVWAIDESAGGDGVVVDKSIIDLVGLKGKKVAAEPGFPPNFVLLYLLHKNGMALSDVQFKDMTTQNASTAFASGAVDAAGLYEPYLSNAKNHRAGSKVVISSADTPGLIVDLIFADSNLLESRSSDIKAIIHGWRNAMQFISSSPDEAYEIMAKHFNLPVKEFKDIASGVKWLDLKENRLLFGTEQDPGPLYKNFELVGDVLRRNRPSVYRAKSKDYLTRTFVATEN